MSTLVFLLEEPSAKNLLRAIVEHLVPKEIAVQYIVFEGKQDLERELKRKLRFWCAPDSRFIVMRDQDSGDCITIKNKLLDIVTEAGRQETTLVRIACRELEAFFLGDLAAVEKGLNLRRLSTLQNKNPYRAPDALPNASQVLKTATKDAYRKLEGSRLISPHLDLSGKNKSHSFNVLVEAIQRQVAALTANAQN